MTAHETFNDMRLGPCIIALGMSVLIATTPSVSRAQPQPTSPPAATVPADATEETLVDQIRRLQTLTDGRPTNEREAALRIIARQELLALVDSLVTRFPDSGFQGQALVIRLQTLAALSRAHPTYLGLLLSETTRISASHPKEPLAAENDFYAIQAFVLGARREGMTEERRVLGTIERYEAFLTNHPKSDHLPVIRASLVRGLLSQKLLDRAVAQVARLQTEFPDHAATQRAVGQLFLATAVGKPFAFTHTTSDGHTIKTTDRLGKVLIVHFWAAREKRSTTALPELVSLYQAFHDKGLELIGVNVDADRNQMTKAMGQHDMPWPQYFDEKGMENDVLVATGVVRIPTYFVIDRKGILRAMPAGNQLRGLVEKLLVR